MEMLYNIAVEAPDEQCLIQWGNERGWLETRRDLLDKAARISLIPKEMGELPVVTVQLGNGKRWIVFSRVYGRLPGGRVRLYCIGWQATVKGVNVKSLLWVYPTGDVECSELPSYWKELAA